MFCYKITPRQYLPSALLNLKMDFSGGSRWRLLLVQAQLRHTLHKLSPSIPFIQLLSPITVASSLFHPVLPAAFSTELTTTANHSSKPLRLRSCFTGVSLTYQGHWIGNLGRWSSTPKLNNDGISHKVHDPIDKHRWEETFNIDNWQKKKQHWGFFSPWNREKIGNKRESQKRQVVKHRPPSYPTQSTLTTTSHRNRSFPHQYCVYQCQIGKKILRDSSS